MKKLLSLLLCAAVLLAALPVCALAGADAPVSFAVASDIHYNLPEPELSGEIDDPVYWYANRRAAMENESGAILDAFLAQCAENDACRFVLIAGDLADNGRRLPEEHFAVAEKLAAFEAATGKQVYVIDGNHDLGTDAATTVESFRQIYREFGYREARSTLEGTCSYTAELDARYRLIALDSCDPDKSTEDGMTAQKVRWVLREAKQAKQDGKYPILMMHHNLLDHLPAQRILSHDFIVRFHTATASLFADSGIRLVLSGHEHCSDAAVYTSPAGSRIYDLAVTSLTMYPLQYRLITLSDEKIGYEAKTVASIDTDALAAATAGYTETQLSMLRTDANAYAKGFLKAGVRYRLQLSLSREKLGLSDGAAADLVMRLIDKLTALADAPLYGENSMAQLAAGYGISLPTTEYKNGWDLATELVSRHYAGEEPYGPETPEVGLLLKLIAVILRSEFSLKEANELLANAALINGAAAAGELPAQLRALCLRTFGSLTPFSYLAAALLSPFLYAFAFDADGVNDNCGELEGYAVRGENGAFLSESLVSKLRKLFSDLSLILRTFLRYFERG